MTNNTDNPHNFEPGVLEALADTSGKMYDSFYDLLATYQFDFTFEQKVWMLERIVKDITEANKRAEMEFGDDPFDENDLDTAPTDVVE